ncbi:MAG: hypothetical protein JWM82_405 [Myxococcales bacterium]|nr:hypothetical protein [Myxococcales bacterium]
MTKSTVLVGSFALAALVGAAIFLRSSPSAKDELSRPTTIPAAMLSVIKTKMGRHEAQMHALWTRVVLLDDDGVARAAGEIFDEPSLARPLTGDELNGMLPERFFVLQDELRRRARQLVIASGRHDRTAVASEFAELSKTCISCHEVYLNGDATTRAAAAP